MFEHLLVMWQSDYQGTIEGFDCRKVNGQALAAALYHSLGG